MKNDSAIFANELVLKNFKNRVIKSVAATLSSKALNHIMQLLATMVLARVLEPNDFGLVAMVTSFYLYFRLIRHFGLYDATIQKEEINHQLISNIFWINGLYGLVLTILFICAAPLIALLYDEKKLFFIAVVFSVDFIFSGFSIQHRALLQRQLKNSKIAIIEITSTFLGFSIAIIAALFGFGYWSLVLRFVIYAISESIGYWIFSGWVPSMPNISTDVLRMVKFGFDMIKNMSINYISQNIDKVLIGWHLGAQSLGYYNRAFYLFMAPAEQLSQPLVGVAIGTLSRLQNDPIRFTMFYVRAISMLTFIGAPISVILAVLGNDIIYVVLGPKWEEAGIIFTVLGFGVAIQILYSTNGWIHIATGRADRWLKWNCFALIVFLSLFLIALPFGARGVAASYVLALYLLLLPSIWYAGLLVKIKVRNILSETWKYFLSAFISGMVSYGILRIIPLEIISKYISSITNIIIGSAMILLIYCLVTIILYRSLYPFRNLLDYIKEFKR